MNRKTLFIISSAISVSTNPLCYSPTRSAYTDQVRARQTLKTIQSIRDYIPNAKILFIEIGLDKNLPYQIEKKVDKYVYLGDKRIIRDAADGPYKGLGEAISLYLSHRWISSFNADYYYKLSGRYFLNQQFKEFEWIGNAFTGKNYHGGLFTVLYGFPAQSYLNWRYSLKQSIPGLVQGQSIEIIQPSFFEKPIHYLDTLGVSGWESHSGNSILL
ncbi:hypothetical protein [Rossellomorea aquimaris]|uniref:hypothetical protein n=1 Tax=Rossellomorea aquimaris TaxID=189382 RepID=UPI0007D066A6|nr:hypothetical protein [Rossellomorea aquimaris]